MNMGRASTALLQCLVCLSLVGCEKGFARDVAPAQGGAGDSPVEIARAGIDTTISLGDWLKAHPRDSVAREYLEKRGWDGNSFCRVAVAKSTFANRRTTRSALFHAYLPVGERIPADTTRFAERVCYLRTIFFETEALDSAVAITLSDSITSLIESRVGRAERGIKADEGTSRTWVNGRTWRTPGTTAVIAVAARRVVILAYAPGSSLQHQDLLMARHSEAEERQAEERARGGVSENPALRDADSAIAWARLPSVAADLSVMIGVRRRSEPRTLKADSALIRAFRVIRDTAPSLEPPRRAAALLAAELVRYELGFLQYNAGPQDRALFNSLHKIIHGSTAEFSRDDNSFNRAWLWEAYRLDPHGRAGHLAFVRLLKRGFRQDAECAEDVGFYNAMIERGEAYLRRGTKDPLVHFYVGVAYKSIFDLAHTDPGIWVEQPPTRSEAEAARVRAIDHLRAAFPGLRDRSMRNEAWHYAHRLLLGQPESAWMFCASD